jgi:hypothetical protein
MAISWNISLMSKTMKAIKLDKLESERAAIRNRKDEKPSEVAAYFCD